MTAALPAWCQLGVHLPSAVVERPAAPGVSARACGTRISSNQLAIIRSLLDVAGKVSGLEHQRRARSWHVGEPHLSHYTAWFLGRADGAANTGGAFDARMYRYAIQPEAQAPSNASACFNVLP